MSVIWSFTIRSFHNASIFRLNFWLQIISSFFVMYSVYWVWKTLHSQNPAALVVSLEQMITYGVLGVVFELIHSSGTNAYISKQIRLGTIDNDFLKPIDFHFHMFARDFGETLFRLIILVIPALIVAFLFLEILLPENIISFVLFVISFFLGYLIFFHLNFMVGLINLFTLNVSGIEWTYYALLRLLSGQFIPLWMFSGILFTLANFLPFKGLYFIPFSIYIGNFSNTEIIEGLSFQIIWIISLYFICRILWNVLYKHISTQGG